MSKRKFSYSFILFLKYEIYSISSTIILTLLQHFLVDLPFQLNTDSIYFEYKSLISSFLTYILLCLYIYGKRLLALHIHSSYAIIFTIACLLSTLTLTYLSILLNNNLLSISDTLSVIFSFVFIIIAICMTAYHRIIIALETENRQRITIAKYELEKNYYLRTETSMEDFSKIRHDFKNHLIVLDGYAAQGEISKLQDYIASINANVSSTRMIQTPHALTSAILNEKAAACREASIDFQTECFFDHIAIDDYHLIILLGNILDNAVTAAGKCPHGSIRLAIRQKDSFLSIQCENNHCEKLIIKHDDFLSTKESPGLFHGLGIKNIQSSVSELNGTLDIRHDDSHFSVSVLVPNYE